MKFLVFTTDVPPLRGLPTSGTALRTFGLMRGLEAHGHKVVVSAPKLALQGLKKSFDLAQLPQETQENLRVLEDLSFDPYCQADVLRSVQPDAILCGHWPAMCLRVKPDQPIIVDLAGPHLLERHFQGMPEHDAAVLGKLTVIATADYFIVSGESQRLYFLSFMVRAGVDDPRMVTIPMPLSPELPPLPARNELYPRFVFAGVFLPWQDPSSALRTLTNEIKTRQHGKLSLIGGPHPNYTIQEGGYAKLFDELRALDGVESAPMLPYEEFTAKLREQDVALDLMRWNLERELALTIRSTTYLWSGLPVIYNDFADLGGLIDRYDAGWCVPPENEAALQAVLREIYAKPDQVQQKGVNAQRLARELFSWDEAVKPLLSMLGLGASKKARETDIVIDYLENADLPVLKKSAVRQQFICRADGLSRVECKIATHGRRIATGLTFRLSRASDRRSLGERVVQAHELQNNDWIGLEFPRIDTSAGEEFIFEIESAETEIERSVCPWAAKSRPYPLRTLRHGNQEITNGSLCMRTSCTVA